MRGLLPYAWRSLVARPARSFLTITGIALAVGVLVAALGVSAGLDASIDRTVASLVGRADLRVSAFTEQGLDADTLAAIEELPGVALTAPAIERRTFLGTSPERPTPGAPVAVVGIDPMREARVRDLTLASGSALTTIDEPSALVSERFAREESLAVGDELAIQGAAAPVRVRIVGMLAGDGPAFGTGPRTVVLPIVTAASLAQFDGATPPEDGRVTGLARIDVILAAGADATAVQAGMERVVVQPYILSIPEDIAASMRSSTRDVRATMALLAAITLFGAAFLILNTLGMTVVERVRELGLLRASGASRAQVIRVVATQALLLGTTGSALGLALGVLLATAIASGLRAAGAVQLDGPAFPPAVLALGFVAGLAVTLVAAVEPARRAGAVSPITALRARSDPTSAVRGRVGWLVVVVAVLTVIAATALPADDPMGVVRLVAIYAVMLLAVLLTPALVGPLGRIAGLPFSAAYRLEERLARAAIARDRSRTALTVGALVVGLAMVVGLGVVAANARLAATAWLADVVPGEEILTAVAPVPVGGEDTVREIADIEGVAIATPIASFDLAFRGVRLDATAVVGADMERDGRLTFTAGDRTTALDALDAGGAVILPRSRATVLGVGIDDVLAVPGSGGLVELAVVGIVERSFPGRTGETVLVGWPDALDQFGVAGADAIAVRYEPGAADTAGPAVRELAIQQALTPAPISEVEGAVGAALDRVFGLLDLIALAAVLVAALGIVNTLSMDVLERVRELGMLRAAGMSRRQAWRSVIVEAGILGAIGASMGVAAGLAVGVVLVATSGASLDAGIVVPWATIGVVLAMGVIVAVLAAAQPARMAAARSIVGAVRVE